jgi:hypothetical protein
MDGFNSSRHGPDRLAPGTSNRHGDSKGSASAAGAGRSEVRRSGGAQPIDVPRYNQLKPHRQTGANYRDGFPAL